MFLMSVKNGTKCLGQTGLSSQFMTKTTLLRICQTLADPGGSSSVRSPNGRGPMIFLCQKLSIISFKHTLNRNIAKTR